MAELLNLPNELIEFALADTDTKSLLRCRRVCQLLNRLILTSTFLQYKIELAMDGMVDGPSGGMNTMERLQALRKRRKAWNNMRFAASQTVLLNNHALWAFSGRFFAQVLTDSEGQVEVVQLSSKVRGIPQRSWIIEDLGIPVDEFVTIDIDPVQDLLILIHQGPHGCMAQLRSLSTGKWHPSAHGHSFSVCAQVHNLYECQTEIFADRLAIRFDVDILEEGTWTWSPTLTIYNWKTGTLQMRLRSKETFGFAFLTGQYLLFNTYTGYADEQYTLSVFDIDAFLAQDEGCELSFSTVATMCQFGYPPSHLRPRSPCIHHGPPQSWKPPHDLQVPFYTSQDERLFVVACHCGDHALMIPSSSILKHLCQNTNGMSPRRLSWEQWGPESTRLVTSRVHDCLPNCTYGTSFIPPRACPSPQWDRHVEDSEDRSVEMHLYDFGPLGTNQSLADPGPAAMPGVQSLAENISGCYPEASLLPYTTTVPARTLSTKLDLDHNREHLSDILLGEDVLMLVYSSHDLYECQFLSF